MPDSPNTLTIRLPRAVAVRDCLAHYGDRVIDAVPILKALDAAERSWLAESERTITVDAFDDAAVLRAIRGGYAAHAAALVRADEELAAKITKASPLRPLTKQPDESQPKARRAYADWLERSMLATTEPSLIDLHTLMDLVGGIPLGLPPYLEAAVSTDAGVVALADELDDRLVKTAEFDEDRLGDVSVAADGDYLMVRKSLRDGGWYGVRVAADRLPKSARKVRALADAIHAAKRDIVERTMTDDATALPRFDAGVLGAAEARDGIMRALYSRFAVALAEAGLAVVVADPTRERTLPIDIAAFTVTAEQWPTIEKIKAVADAAQMIAAVTGVDMKARAGVANHPPTRFGLIVEADTAWGDVEIFVEANDRPMTTAATAH